MKVNKQILMRNPQRGTCCGGFLRFSADPAAALPSSPLVCASLPYLYMICKSFIPNLNLIDPADLRMHPLLGVSAACERCVWGEEIQREQTAV